MTKQNRNFVALVGVLAFAGFLQADTDLTLHYDGPATFVPGQGFLSWQGYYVSPYLAHELPDATKTWVLYCVDFNHGISLGRTWDAHLSRLDVTDLADTLYNSLEGYSRAAWLFSQYLQAPTYENQKIYQVAVWSLFVDAAHLGTYNAKRSASPADFNNDVEHALTASLAHWNTSDSTWGAYAPSRWEVVTGLDTGDGIPQEFMTLVHTPEPASILLFGTCLLGVATLIRRRLTNPLRRESHTVGQNPTPR